jgi:hypothetical protein
MKSPSEWVGGPGVDGARRWFSRYSPFIVTIVAIALIAIFLPGRSNTTQTTNEASGLSASAPQVAAANAAAANAAANTAAAAQQKAANTQVQANPNVLTFAEALKRGVQLEASCDSKAGHIKWPSWGAPPCTQALVGANGGNTWQGVTRDKIKVVYFIACVDPATQAILRAAGAADTEDQVKQQVREWIQLYSSTLNLWGRKVDLVFVKSSAPGSDCGSDTIAHSDAIKIVKEIKPFATLNSGGSNGGVFVDDLVAHHVLCMCTVELPNSFYTRWAPYVWSTLQSADHTQQLLQEYLLKRLNNRKAQWAGTSDGVPLSLKNRVFGLLQYETKAYAYKAGAERFKREMAAKGINIKVVYFNGYPELATNQEQARPDIQIMKQAGVTSIICGCDPFAPIFFTQEATRQNYFPEWIDVGSALTDTTFFGRTYDPTQWAHAFGIGQLVARLPEKLGDNYHLYNWYFHKDPTARAGYGVIRAPIDLFFRGVHAAGPVLTPKTFQSGMFSQPVVGANKKTVISVGFGTKLYPVSAWTAFHDITEIWWNRTQDGPDEIGGSHGVGMWEYVNGGLRYLPGQIPSGSPKMFDPNGAINLYDNYPPGEAPPNYPSIH